MKTLQEFFRYNRWADARVFKVCDRADAGLLTVDAAGTNGTVLSTLAHMCSTSEGFAALVAAGTGGAGQAAGFLVTPTGLAEGYGDHDLGWYAERVTFLDSFFHDLVDRLDQSALEQQVEIPWFGFAISTQQILMQVLVHSGHHRSQVFSALGAQGIKVPDLDYIVMLAKERAET